MYRVEVGLGRMTRHQPSSSGNPSGNPSGNGPFGGTVNSEWLVKYSCRSVIIQLITARAGQGADEGGAAPRPGHGRRWLEDAFGVARSAANQVTALVRPSTLGFRPPFFFLVTRIDRRLLFRIVQEDCWPRYSHHPYWVLPCPYWVLPSFTGFYRVFTGFYRVIVGLIGFCYILLCFTGFYWLTIGFTGVYWVLLCFSGFYIVLLGERGLGGSFAYPKFAYACVPSPSS